MRPGPTPERVLAICRLINKFECTSKDIFRFCELNDKTKAEEESIRRSIEAAEEIGLISKNGEKYKLQIDSINLESASVFRRFIAPLIFQNPNSVFFRMTEWYISNADLVNTINRFDDFAAIAAKNGVESITENDVLGWRFWMRYLGHAYQYNKTLIPNMKIRIEDALINIPSDTKMTCTEFVMWLKSNIPEASKACNNGGLPLAVSNGLRSLQSEGKIELISTRDAIRVALYPLKGVELNDFSDVIIKGA